MSVCNVQFVILRITIITMIYDVTMYIVYTDHQFYKRKHKKTVFQITLKGNYDNVTIPELHDRRATWVDRVMVNLKLLYIEQLDDGPVNWRILDQ